MKILTKLTQEQKEEVTKIVNKIPDYIGDFYLTSNNLRLYVRENLEILFELLEKGDKIVYCNEGIGIVNGYADKFKRKYVKLLTNNFKTGDEILQLIIWDSEQNLWVKLKKNNPLLEVFKNNGFLYVQNRGQEELLTRGIQINSKGRY